MFVLFSLGLLAGAPPLTLEAATDIALERANDMIQAKEDAVLVDVEYLEALSAVLPRVDLEISAGEFFAGGRILESRNPVPAQLPTEFPQVRFGPFRDAKTNNYSHPDISLGLTARQLIYDGGRWWTVLAKVEDGRDARAAALEDVTRAVRARVAVAFYELEKARRQIEAVEAQVEVDLEQLTRAEGLMRAGRGRRADVAAARRDLARDRISLRNAQTEARAARRRFNLTLGRDPAVQVELTMPAHVRTATRSKTWVPSYDRLRELAVAHHPQLRAARAELRALDKDVEIAAAEYWPALALQTSYRRSSRRPDRVFANPFDNYIATVDLVMQWNLFAGLATNAAVERALVAKRKAEAAYADSERTILGLVDERREVLAAQQDILRLAAEEIDAAEEAVRLARGLFEAGRGSALELRTAQLGRTQSRLTGIGARLDLEVARAQLTQAVGTEAWETAGSAAR